MTELFNNLVEQAKKNRKGLIAIKNAAVANGQFELASRLRAIEVECFPETDEVKSSKERARKNSDIFSMVNLRVEPATAWLIEETLKVYAEKGGNFSVDDATTLRLKQEELFLTD